MEVPSMVRRSGGKLIVRRVVSGEEQLVLEGTPIKAEPKGDPERAPTDVGERRTTSDNGKGSRQERLPQCRVKRNYSCGSCRYFTQNPRSYLTHQRDTHGERISIYECKRCLYASRHHQKLVRHMKMVHGSSVEPAKASPRRRRIGAKRIHPGQPRYGAADGAQEPDALEAKTLEELSNEYTQQLVASQLPTLLKDIEHSWATTILANFEVLQKLFTPDMEGGHNIVTPDQDTIRNEETEKHGRKSSEESESVPRKRPRPIPNLIPLEPPSAVVAKSEKELLKPVPMSVLMPPNANAGTSPDVPLTQESQTKCTFCELTFETTIDLANHIATAHKEDLITSLLQKSIDESNQNLFPQSDTDSGSNEMWRSLLETSLFNGPADATVRPSGESDGKQPSHAKEDDDVEILEARSATYCGVETAPGYGEVTSKLQPSEGSTATVMKKVFKCPHCSFWASTASRFHVHIVGHLNKKPFECSLCSYRSNWRWDITKHIRLKTIRDPSHKNAGVLMNDETGRRNYTKYNKYVTLMHITDNSTREPLSGYPKPFADNSSVTDLMSSACTNAYNIDLKTFGNMPGFQLLLDDKQTGDDPVVGHTEVKCQMCDFRSITREELLVHMATVHAALFQPEDANESETGSNPSGQNNNIQLQSKNSTTNNSSTTPASTPTPPATALSGHSSKSAANTSVDSPTNGTVLTASSGAGDRANPVEPGDRAGDGEGNTHRVAMSATWRHSAPYRCGHCHQVSNWKHVIQRHCRLKHNGHVFIEHVNAEKDDSCDADGQRNTNQTQQSVYVVEDVLHSTGGPIDSSRKSNEPLVTTSIPPPLAPFQMDQDVANTLEPIVEIIDKDPSELIGFNGGVLPTTVLVDSGTAAPAVPSEQLECISCQYRAETVEQLTDHLEQHMRNSHDGPGSYDPSGLLDTVPTTMYYCPRCPARFFDEGHTLEHQTKHSAIDGEICPYCSYTTNDEEERKRHVEVHYAPYNINTNNLQIFLAESKKYTKPQLSLKEANGKQVFYVEPLPEDVPPQPVQPKRSKRSKQRVPSPESTNGDDGGQMKSIFLCEYCDQTFDVERDLNVHVRKHFSAILSPQDVTYYASLSNSLNRDKKLELIVSGAQSATPLHYVYDNARKKDWNVYSKTESVLLKF